MHISLCPEYTIYNSDSVMEAGGKMKAEVLRGCFTCMYLGIVTEGKNRVKVKIKINPVDIERRGGFGLEHIEYEMASKMGMGIPPL